MRPLLWFATGTSGLLAALFWIFAAIATQAVDDAGQVALLFCYAAGFSAIAYFASRAAK